ncbi:MAG: hypothetical protein MI757_09910 [Pirellulales bacterium]|nr:hypothetical protein [Pirellulales bacterium]
MPDASTSRKRFSRVCRQFETSRVETALLASAYEWTVPIVSRRTRRKVDASLAAAQPAQTDVAQAEMDFTSPLAKERQVG